MLDCYRELWVFFQFKTRTRKSFKGQSYLLEMNSLEDLHDLDTFDENQDYNI